MPDQFISSLNNIESPLGGSQEVLPTPALPETKKAKVPEEIDAAIPPVNTEETTEQKPSIVDNTTPEITTKDVSGDKNTNIANELEKELITSIHNLPNDKS